MPKELISYLSQCLTPERVAKMEHVLNQRTRYLTVVLEDIYQNQNASAVLRTCECLGIQDIHIIENNHQYNINPDIVLGSDNWLTFHKYNKKNNNNSIDAIQSLKKQGYRIIATTPHKRDSMIDDFDLQNGKTALIFGTELTGLSNDVLNAADGFLKIPMYGLTESFNISVTAAIVLSNLIDRLRKSNVDFKLTEEEIDALKVEWYTRSTRLGDMVVKRFYEEHSSK